MAESKDNRSEQFQELEEDLQKVLLDLEQQQKLIEISYGIGIRLNSRITNNKKLYNQAKELIKRVYTRNKQKFALEVLNILYSHQKILTFKLLNEKYQEAKKITFDILPEELQFLLSELQKKHIIKWDHEGFSFQLSRYEQHANEIINKFPKQTSEYNFMQNLVREIQENTDNRHGYIINNKVHYSYEDLLPLWELEQPSETANITPDEDEIETIISGGEDSESQDEDDLGGGSARSDPHLFVPKRHSTIDTEDLYEYLREEQWAYCIWISKTDRVHNLQAKGRLDEEGSVFRKIQHGLNLEFSPKNGQCYVVHAADNLGFSWQLSQHGYMHFWFDDSCSWELLIKYLKDKLDQCNLTQEEFALLLEELKTANTEEEETLFEVANDIGPDNVIEQFFNKSALIYHTVPYEGKFYDVLVKIDKSKGPYEIEFIGPEGPTRNLQDLTVRPFEVCQSLSQFQFIIQNLVESTVRTQHAVHRTYKLSEKVFENTEEIKLGLEGQDTQLENIQNTVISNGDTMQVLQTKMDTMEDQSEIVNQIKTKITRIYRELRPSQDTSVLTTLAQETQTVANTLTQLIEAQTDIKDTQLQKTEKEHEQTRDLVIDCTRDLHQNITDSKEDIITKLDDLDESFNTKFDNFQQYITSEFASTRSEVRNSLYLILRKLDKVPARTASELQEELNVSKRTVYNYLNKLRKHGLIQESKEKRKTKGRPATQFIINFKKLVKKLKGG